MSSELEQYRKTIALILRRNDDINPVAFSDPAQEVRFLRAHMLGNHLLLQRALGHYEPPPPPPRQLKEG